MGSVYRVHDLLTGAEVALKRVRDLRITNHNLRDLHLLSLTREFRLLASLRHPHIISVLDYGFDARRHPFYTMDLLVGARTITEQGLQEPLDRRLAMLTQMFQALAYLHARSTLHCDLKPRNVMLVEGEVKVLDFGLSLLVEEASKRPVVGGTHAYLSPELRSGGKPSTASDLYAAGLIAYQMLGGRHPFAPLIPGLPMIQPVADPDPADPVFASPVGDVVRRLMAYAPEDRPSSAAAVIDAFAGGRVSVPIRVRESFLQAATLVGRDTEVEHITQRVKRARRGLGGLLLVGGRSGVGKSRLLEECRIQALVEGFQVIRGQDVREGGSTYHPWRQILRQLALVGRINDLDGGVLKQLIPDLGSLLDRQVADAPALNPEAQQGRLMAAVQSLLMSLKGPVVIILEDLHWAQSDTIALLAGIYRAMSEHAVMILGSYRDDEAPRLPQRFPGCDHLLLLPLAEDQVIALAESMIGDVAHHPRVASLLKRETGGNAFFLVEVVRVLADRVGGLDRIDAGDLPDHLFPGGVRELVDRRLNLLPAQDRELMLLAALIGRQLDLPSLISLNGGDIGPFLLRGADAAVLETVDGGWRFVHEKLRDGLVDGAPAAGRPALHRRIAEVIEAGTQDPSLRCQELAHHWGQAGVSDQEYNHSAVASRRAIAAGAYPEALRYLQRMRIIQAEVPHPALKRSQVFRMIADAHFRSGNIEAASDHLLQALDQLHIHVPIRGLRRICVLIRELLRQAFSRGGPSDRQGFPDDSADEIRAELEEASLAAELLARLDIYRGDHMGLVVRSLLAIAWGDKAGRPNSFALSILGNATGSMGLRGPSNAFFARARHSSGIVATANRVDTMAMEAACHIGQCRWAEAEAILTESVAMAVAMGYGLGASQASAQLAICDLNRGRLRQMLARSEAAMAQLGDHSDGHRPGIANSNALARFWLGEAAIAEQSLLRYRSALAPDDLLVQALTTSGLAMVRLRLGRMDDALDAVEETDPLVRGATSVMPPCGQILTGPLEVLIAAWWRALDEGRPTAAIIRRCNRFGGMLARWSRMMPIGRPWLAWYRAQRALLAGRQAQAIAILRQGILFCKTAEMELMQGLLHLDIGRYGPFPDRANELRQAISLFTRCEAAFHLQESQTLLSSLHLPGRGRLSIDSPPPSA